jgi:glycosyltransferase involved in cell wall biosynthesis
MEKKCPQIKILVDGHVFDHSFQGKATYIIGIYNSIVKNENLRITICAQDIESLKLHFKDSRFEFIKLKYASKLIRLAIEFPRIIRKGNFHYAHFQYIVPFVKNCKFINTIHDILFLTYKQYFPLSYRLRNTILFRFSAKRSDIILTVSNYSKNDLIRRFNIPDKLIYVTPNAVDFPTLPSIDTIEHFRLGKYILYVSRFEPRKNHVGLLKAFYNLNLQEKGYKLVFVGSKKDKIEKQAYQKLVKLITLTQLECVEFFDHLSSIELNYLYNNASCFVFPSLAEGFGIPPIEAAVNNCKVVCSNQTAMRDFSFFKYLFDPNDQDEFDTQLHLALEDIDYDYKFYREKVLEIYNWNNIAEGFYHVILDNFAQ